MLQKKVQESEARSKERLKMQEAETGGVCAANTLCMAVHLIFTPTLLSRQATKTGSADKGTILFTRKSASNSTAATESAASHD